MMNVIPITAAGSLFEEQLQLRFAEEMLRLVRAQQSHDELQIMISKSVIDDLRHLAERNDGKLDDEYQIGVRAAG